jgi:hypothetical protein
MIDPDKLPDAAVDANDSHIDSRKGLAAAIEALLADDETMVKAAQEYHAHNVASWKGASKAMRAALTAAFQEGTIK